MPEYIRLITSVCAHVEERKACVFIVNVNIEQFVNTSHSWTFDKKEKKNNTCTKTTENKSIWDKSLILDS